MRRGRTPFSRLVVPSVPPGAVAAGAYAVVLLVLLWPALSGDRVLAGAGDLYHWVPWRSSRPRDLHDSVNPLLFDQTVSFVPWLSFARDQLHAGHLPQWNPLALSGTPFLANGQSQLFSVFSLPVWLCSLNYGLAVSAALRLWVASMGTYALARQLRLGFWPSLLGGLAFGLSPFLLVWLYHPLSAVVAMLPWGLLFTERIAAGGGRRDVAGLAVALGVMNLSGYPGGQAHVCLGVVVYAVARLLTAGALPWRGRAARLGLVIAGMALGAMLAAFLLVPVALGIPGTAGVDIRAGGGGWVPSSGLRTLFFPDWWGRPGGASAGGPGSFALRDAYIGAVPLLLAAVAVVHRGDWRRKAPFAALALFGLGVAFGVQPLHWLIMHTPPFDHAMNKLLLMFGDMGGAMLAAFGLEELLRTGRVDRRTAGVAAAGVAVALVAAVGVRPGSAVLHAVWHHFTTGETVAAAKVLALISVAWWGIFAAGFALGVALRRWVSATGAAVLCVALVAVDAAHVLHGYQPMVPAHAVYPATPALRYLHERVGGARMMAISPAMPADTGTVYGLRDVRGLDPPQPSVAYYRLVHLQRPDIPLRASTYLSDITPLGARALDLLSVRYVLTVPGDPPHAPGFVPAYRGKDAWVFENTGAVARASVPASVTERRGDSAALDVLRAPGFAPGRDAVTDGPAVAGSGAARVTADTGDGVTIEANMQTRGLVVLADRWADGWSVTVDGRSQPALRVDAALRGVVVDAGRHTVEWQYATPGLVPGSVVSLATLVLGAAWVVLPLRRRRAPGTSGSTTR
jgi:hypothetical protein